MHHLIYLTRLVFVVVKEYIMGILETINRALNSYLQGWDAATGTDLFADYLEEGGDEVHGSFEEWLKKWPDTGTYPARLRDDDE